MARPEYSVIVPIWNRLELITHYFHELQSALDLNRHEVIVAFDGGVSPAVKRYVEGLRPQIPTMTLVETERQLGYAATANRAVTAASGDILVFTDSDVFPVAGAVELLAGFVAAHDDVGAAQGLLLYPQSLTVQSAGHLIFDFWNFHAYEHSAATRGVIRQPADRQALSTAFLAVRRELFSPHGGFDTFYFNGWEGMELTVKIRMSGYRCVFFPEACGYHVRGSARGRQPQQKNPQETGYFWSKWGGKLKNDLASTLEQQLTAADRARPYILIDGSFAPRFRHIAAEIGLRTDDEIRIADWTGGPVMLQNNVPYHLLASSHDLLFMVNSIVDIAGNALVIDARREQHDLVLDLHGNAVLLRELATHQ